MDDAGSWGDHANVNPAGAGGVQGMNSVPHQGVGQAQQMSGGAGGYNGVTQGGYGARGGLNLNANAGATPSLFHPTEGGYRLGNFYLDRPQVSDYYPAAAQQQQFHQHK